MHTAILYTYLTTCVDVSGPDVFCLYSMILQVLKVGIDCNMFSKNIQLSWSHIEVIILWSWISCDGILQVV